MIGNDHLAHTLVAGVLGDVLVCQPIDAASGAADVVGTTAERQAADRATYIKLAAKGDFVEEEDESDEIAEQAREAEERALEADEGGNE